MFFSPAVQSLHSRTKTIKPKFFHVLYFSINIFIFATSKPLQRFVRIVFSPPSSSTSHSDHMGPVSKLSSFNISNVLLRTNCLGNQPACFPFKGTSTWSHLNRPSHGDILKSQFNIQLPKNLTSSATEIHEIGLIFYRWVVLQFIEFFKKFSETKNHGFRVNDCYIIVLCCDVNYYCLFSRTNIYKMFIELL